MGPGATLTDAARLQTGDIPTLHSREGRYGTDHAGVETIFPVATKVENWDIFPDSSS